MPQRCRTRGDASGQVFPTSTRPGQVAGRAFGELGQSDPRGDLGSDRPFELMQEHNEETGQSRFNDHTAPLRQAGTPKPE
jgi:hypothetical protein